MARSSLVVVALSVVAAPAVQGQRGWDYQGHAIALVRDSTLVGGGAAVGRRFGGGVRLAVTASGGVLVTGGGGAGRGEALLTYHLSPPGGGAGLYLGGGVAGELWSGKAHALLVALLGLEARPWSGGGLFAEVGVGGGARIAVGYRIIRLARRR